MKCSELLRKLKKAGWIIARQGKGSHLILEHPDKPGQHLSFPDHGSAEMATGLEKALKKQAGLK